MKPLLFLVLVAAAVPAVSQSRNPSLPHGALVLERRTLPLGNQPARELMLWMLNPKKYPSGYNAEDTYTCPDGTRGSYYSGPTRVSLIDTTTGKIINTVNIELEDEGVDIPYAIRKGYYYRVNAQTKSRVEVKPNIIWLRDYNGDGKALEFALFNAEACMGLETTLIGYSTKRDQVINYPLILHRSGEKTETIYWIDYLFREKPVAPRHWKYEIDYRGRGGELEKWDIRYIPDKEQFEGTFTSVSE